MTRPSLPAPRGVTLIELLVALAVSTIVVAAASMLLIGQQRAHVAGSGQRALQETARVALGEIGRNLRDAGYGVDPAITFDFGAMDNVPRETLFTAKRGFIAGYRCAAPVFCRDRLDGPDEIVFYRRDPLFSRRVSGVNAPNTVTLRGTLREPLLPGQVLQILCLNEPRTVAYVTVGAFVDAPTIQNANADVTVPLAAGQSGGALNLPAFPFENGELSSPCFLGGLTAVVAAKIDRFRFYVETYDDAGRIVAPQTPGSRPYLMLDQGLASGGQPLVAPVAPDVEDLQLAYMYPPDAPGRGSRLFGAREGQDLVSAGVSVNDIPPGMGDPPDAPSRRTGNPTNILGVRIAVVVRTPEPDVNRLSANDQLVPASGNRPNAVGLPMYRRAQFQTTILLKNMQSRDVIYPVVDPTRAIVGSLVGGG